MCAVEGCSITIEPHTETSHQPAAHEVPSYAPRPRAQEEARRGEDGSGMGGGGMVGKTVGAVNPQQERAMKRVLRLTFELLVLGALAVRCGPRGDQSRDAASLAILRTALHVRR